MQAHPCSSALQRSSCDEYVKENKEEEAEFAYKPGSVLDSHSSRACVTTSLKRPTRIQRGPRLWIPIWSCSEWGLPSPWNVATHAVRSYRTFSTLPALTSLGGVLSVALSVGSRPPDVIWHSALWSPDFPPPACRRRLSGELRAARIPCQICLTSPRLIRMRRSVVPRPTDRALCVTLP